MLFGIAADMPPQDITPERLADLLKVAECGDIEGWRLDFITALRELERHRAARNADTWPMCDADAERMEKAAAAIEILTREREAALNIATRRTEEHMQFQRERDEAVSTMTSYYDRIQKLQQRELELASLLGRAIYYVRFHKTAAACELDDEIKAAIAFRT